jgi:hypothetical protein
MHYTHDTIENLLERFRQELNEDYDKYKNHVYRVFNNCLLIDPEKENEEKYAIAAVFHDIGIWTDHTIDYLNPSMKEAALYLSDQDKHQWMDEIALMIDFHHKRSTYTGKYEQTVECFRKADWIDVSLGLISFGTDKQKISMIRKQWPNLGFHLFLLGKIYANLFKKPFNPLPMFKK